MGKSFSHKKGRRDDKAPKLVNHWRLSPEPRWLAGLVDSLNPPSLFPSQGRFQRPTFSWSHALDQHIAIPAGWLADIDRPVGSSPYVHTTVVNLKSHQKSRVTITPSEEEGVNRVRHGIIGRSSMPGARPRCGSHECARPGRRDNCGSSKVISHAVEKALHEHFAPICDASTTRCPGSGASAERAMLSGHRPVPRLHPHHAAAPAARLAPQLLKGGRTGCSSFPAPCIRQFGTRKPLAIRPCSRGDALARAVF